MMLLTKSFYQYFVTDIVCLLVFLVFGEDEANRINRLDIRYDFDDRLGAMVLSRPLPFDRPHLDVPISAQATAEPMSTRSRHE